MAAGDKLATEALLEYDGQAMTRTEFATYSGIVERDSRLTNGSDEQQE